MLSLFAVVLAVAASFHSAAAAPTNCPPQQGYVLKADTNWGKKP
jgi:hypothetical protein